jgi:hypothetical protein
MIFRYPPNYLLLYSVCKQSKGCVGTGHLKQQKIPVPEETGIERHLLI